MSPGRTGVTTSPLRDTTLAESPSFNPKLFRVHIADLSERRRELLVKRRAVPGLCTGMIVGISTARCQEIRIFIVRHFLRRTVIDDMEKPSAACESYPGAETEFQDDRTTGTATGCLLIPVAHT